MTSVGEGNSWRVALGWLAVRLASVSFFSSFVTRAWDDATAAWFRLRLFLPPGCLRLRAVQLGLETLDRGFALLLRRRLFFFVAMGRLPRRS